MRELAIAGMPLQQRQGINALAAYHDQSQTFLPQSVPFLPQAYPFVRAQIPFGSQQIVNNSPLQGMPLPPDHYPQFLNPLQQKMAEASGLINPNYSDPRAELEHHLNNQIAENQNTFEQQQDAEYQRRAQLARSAYVPQLNDTGRLSNPDEFLTTQLAGDRGGTVANILHSMQNVPVGQQVQPYLPAGRYGKMDLDRTELDPIDRTVYNDPTFQRELARDPARAAFAYKQLVKRNLTEDIAAHEKFRQKQIDTGYSFAQDALKQGAIFDPVKRTWKVWNTAPDTGDSLSLTTPHPFRQLVDATEQQNIWLNQHHKNVTGHELPAAPPVAPKSAQLDAQRLQKNPEIKAAIIAKETKLGRSLTPQEQQVEGSLYLKDQADIAQFKAKSNEQPAWRQALNMGGSTFQSMLGFKPTPIGTPFEDAYYPKDDMSNLNFFGKFLRHPNQALPIARPDIEAAYSAIP